MNTAKKYRKKPVVIEASQWFENGDHPLDEVQLLQRDSEASFYSEGKIVRYYRHPKVPGQTVCHKCDRTMDDHGWIDTLEDGHAVCPGDWIITGVKGEFYPCKPDIFKLTYDEVNDD